MFLLPQRHMSWDYRGAPPHPASGLTVWVNTFHLLSSFPRDEISNTSLPGSQASSHNPTFLGSSLEETYQTYTVKRPVVSLRRTLTNTAHRTKLGHEVVCRWPPCLPSCGCMAARPHYTTHNDYMELCLGTDKTCRLGELLSASPLPGLQQSSHVMPASWSTEVHRRSHGTLTVASWPWGSSCYVCTISGIHHGPAEPFFPKPVTHCQDDKSTHVSARLKETVLPCPCFNALGHASTRVTSSAAKVRDKEGSSVSLRLIFMLVSRLVGLDPAFCFSHLQMKWHHRFINKALWSSLLWTIYFSVNKSDSIWTYEANEVQE